MSRCFAQKKVTTGCTKNTQKTLMSVLTFKAHLSSVIGLLTGQKGPSPTSLIYAVQDFDSFGDNRNHYTLNTFSLKYVHMNMNHYINY